MPYRARGFTLIELLIVIAIIGVLMGLLLPALASARRSARSVQDLSNLRSLGQALTMYVDQHGVYPAHRLNAPSVHDTSGRPRPRFHWGVSDYLGKPPYLPRTDDEAAAFTVTNDVPRLDNEVFRDPLHTIDDFVSQQTGEIQALRNGSYGYNYMYLGNARLEGPGGAPARWPVRAERVRAPSTTVVFADSMGNQTRFIEHGFREHAYTMDPPRFDPETNAVTFAQSDGKSPAQARHGGRANTAFADGHAEGMTLEDLGYVVADRQTGRVEHDAGSNALWNGMGFDADADP